MKTFEYRGFDLDGHQRTGLVEALDLKDAREKLAKGGVLAERISVAGERGRGAMLARNRFHADRRIMIYRELSSLLRAGLPVVKALDILIESPETGDARRLMAGVRDDIKEGVSLANAMARASTAVGEFEKALITVGERSGTLDTALENLGGFMEEQQTVADRVKTALIYPGIVLGVALFVATAVFVFVLPQTRKYMEEMRVPVPAVTAFMIGMGNAAIVWAGPLAATVALFFFYVRRKLRNDDAARTDLDRRMFGFPVLGRGYSLLACLRFSRTMAILLKGGVSILESLPMAAAATGSAWIGRLAHVSTEGVKQGGSLSDALRTIPPLAASLPGWVQAGEAGGNVESLLENAADRYQRQWERFISRTLSLLEPAVVLLLGVFVLVVALAVLLPVLAGNQALQL